MSATDVTDGNSGEVAHGGEEAAWQDLIGRFDAPAGAPGTPVPWPEREELGPPGAPEKRAARRVWPGDRPAAADGDSAAATDAGAVADTGATAADAAPGDPADTGEGARSDGKAAGAGEGAGSEAMVHPWASLPAPAAPRTWRPPPDEEDEHFTPPPPPPLPSLTPAAKGAWVALFGGPAYLLTATLAGWSVPGWALFAAIAAFVGGFTVLVLRLGDGSGRDSGPGDDGAVV